MLASRQMLALGRLAVLAFFSQSPAQSPFPLDKSVVLWTVAERDEGLRAYETTRPNRVVPASSRPRRLQAGPPLQLPLNLDAYLQSQRVAGLLILHKNKVVLERYGLNFSSQGRWTSFSVAKSITSTLFAAALKDGHLRSLNDHVTQYLPEMKGSAYDGVTLRQLLTMTSGVKWNESYTDPQSDNVKLHEQQPINGLDATVAYLRQLPREFPPGQKWRYSTGETNLIGILLRRAIKKPLSVYLSEKIWKPYGMERDAAWLLNNSGVEISGCCLSASLRDFARFGQFILEGGHGSLPKGWLKEATRKQADIGVPGRGYGYQWWTRDDGSFYASGIYGQSLFLDPSRHLVIATVGNWPTATDPEVLGPERFSFFNAVQSALPAR